MRPATKAQPLRHGERLGQAEFHRRYEAHPDATKFELIAGVVHMASPVSNAHADFEASLSYWLKNYQRHTPGTRAFSNPTTVLDEESEPQPDNALVVLPSHGGRTREVGGYTHGGPELAVQVSVSTLALDLGARRTAYQQAGVIEYLVADVNGGRLRWFDLVAGNEIRARKGVMRSRAFPGLWIPPAAVFADDLGALAAAIEEGVATPAHARFVERLERARRRLAPPGG